MWVPPQKCPVHHRASLSPRYWQRPLKNSNKIRRPTTMVVLKRCRSDLMHLLCSTRWISWVHLIGVHLPRHRLWVNSFCQSLPTTRETRSPYQVWCGVCVCVCQCVCVCVWMCVCVISVCKRGLKRAKDKRWSDSTCRMCSLLANEAAKRHTQHTDTPFHSDTMLHLDMYKHVLEGFQCSYTVIVFRLYAIHSGPLPLVNSWTQPSTFNSMYRGFQVGWGTADGVDNHTCT